MLSNQPDIILKNGVSLVIPCTCALYEIFDPRVSRESCGHETKFTFSPSEGGCCKSDCIFVSSSEDLTCVPEGECSLASKCDGTSAYCPGARRKRDGLECAAGTKVNKSTEIEISEISEVSEISLKHNYAAFQICRAGVCSESVCSKFNQEECQPDDGESCQVRFSKFSMRISIQSSAKSLNSAVTENAP